MLSSSSLSTSSVVGENNPIQSTTKRITGMFEDNSNAMMKKNLNGDIMKITVQEFGLVIRETI